MVQMLDKNSPIPLYYQLKQLIWEKIKSGEFKPGDQLPTEDQLTRQYGVSKTTVRQALAELAIAGALQREQGRGTFVAQTKIEQGPRELTSFSEEMRKRGHHPSSRVLQQDVIEAETDAREKLGLSEGDHVFRLKRLRLADGEPMGIQTAYVPADLVPGIIKVNFEEQSLYEILEKKYGLVPARAQETHFAVLLERPEARLLKVSEGSPALAAERVTFLANDRPLELVYSVMRGDRYKILLHLTRGRSSF